MDAEVPVLAERSGWAPWQLAEQAEAAYMASLRHPAAAGARAELGLTVAQVGGGVVWAARDDPTGGFFSRAVGQGVARPLTAAVVDEVIEVAAGAGAPAIGLQVSPEALDDSAVAVLADRGFSASRTWDKLYRDAAPPPAAATDLRVEVVGEDRADEFAAIVLDGFGMPPACHGLAAAETRTPGWTTYGSFDGDRMVGVAAMYVDGDLAALSGAATLPEARGRGAQRALMARRITDGAAAGVRHFGCETWSEFDDNLNPSLHNMHWAGFRTLYRRVNHVKQLRG